MKKRRRTHFSPVPKNPAPGGAGATPAFVSLIPRSTRLEEPFPVADLSADRLSDIVHLSESGASSSLFRLARACILHDGHVQTELFKRKNAVLGDPISVQPWDPDDPADVEASSACEKLLAALPSLPDALAHLLDASLYPLSLVEKCFGPADPSNPDLGRRTALLDLVPVPYRLIAWDADGYPAVDTSTAALRPADGFRSDLPPLDPNHFILHRGHLIQAPDRYGGPLRAVLWLWLLSCMSITWWARHLERYGSPFIVGRYDDSSSDRDRRVLEAAISYAQQLGGLVVSSGSTIDLKEAATAATNGFADFRSACRDEISRLILGQTLSSTASPTGIGSGATSLQAEVRQDIRRFDARRLAATLRFQLLAPWLLLNGYAGRPPVVLFAEDTSEETERTSKVLGELYNAGLEPTDDALPEISERIGFPIQRRTLAPAAPGGGGYPAFFRGLPPPGDPSFF